MHQLENGYTRIANTILEEIAKLRVSATGFKILIWILRNSYGYNRKKTMPASIRRLGRDINMESSGSIHLALQILLDNGLVIRSESGELELNKSALASVLKTEHLEVFSKLNTTVLKTEQECSQNRTPINYKKDNIKDNSKDTEKTKSKRKFVPPTIQELEAYCAERKNSINCHKFLARYEANGWMAGKTKMTDWKASIRYWEQNDLEFKRAKMSPEQREAELREQQERQSNAK